MNSHVRFLAFVLALVLALMLAGRCVVRVNQPLAWPFTPVLILFEAAA